MVMFLQPINHKAHNGIILYYSMKAGPLEKMPVNGFIRQSREPQNKLQLFAKKKNKSRLYGRQEENIFLGNTMRVRRKEANPLKIQFD